MIEDRCRQGQIDMREFFEFAVWKIPRRTHFLDTKGSYVVLTHISRKDVLVLEKIVKLDYVEKGDFLTKKGTFGPINGNVFIHLDGHSTYLVEGEALNETNCYVYQALHEYLEERRKIKSLPPSSLDTSPALA